MNITYDNLSSPELLVTFTDIPNILKVLDDSHGSKASYTLTFVGNLYGQTNADGQWSITLFDETVTNVLDSSNAVNKAFYVSTANTATAASVARALRNCPNLAANFLVEHNNTSIEITARENGSIFQGADYFNTNIDVAYMNRTGTDGSSNSNLQGALIDVDVFSNGEYITTLEKNWYNGEAAFDMSPVLTTIAEVGKAVPYEFKISSLKGGEYSLLGNIGNNYISVGYMVNQGYKYLVLNGFDIAQNVSRGTSKGVENNTLLYVYGNKIPVSFYADNLGSMNYTITYLDSAYNKITANTYTWYNSDSNQKLKDLELTLDSTYFNQSFYIDVTFGEKTLRYNVIKPLKATEYWQRICWRNSYGGISFFDFTGQKSETRNLELSTYQKNIFGYYDDFKNELNKIYDSKVDYTVTLKSHLFENDGKYIFNDMLQSSEVWTEINGETYGILIDSISVDEQNQNNIYEATVRYKYSQEPSLL